MNLLELSVLVGKELEKVCAKLGLDDHQKDIIDESIMSVFNSEISLSNQQKEKFRTKVEKNNYEGKILDFVITDKYLKLLKESAEKNKAIADNIDDKPNEIYDMYGVVGRSEQLVCDCTQTQACKLCAESKGIDWDDSWDEAN